jgi:uncharacterized phage infection (PIP) family protein YhgE
MSSPAVHEAMVNQALAALKADVNNIKAKRGTQFKISDAQPYVDAVNGMKAVDNELPEVIALHVDSVNAHFEILKDLTQTFVRKMILLLSTIRPVLFWKSSTRSSPISVNPLKNSSMLLLKIGH